MMDPALFQSGINFAKTGRNKHQGPHITHTLAFLSIVGKTNKLEARQHYTKGVFTNYVYKTR